MFILHIYNKAIEATAADLTVEQKQKQQEIHFRSLFSFVPRWIGLGRFRAVAGLHSLSSPGQHAQIRSLRRVKMHEGYSDSTADSDVALVQLSSPLEFTNYIQPVCLPRDTIHEARLNFTHCFVTGWGSAYHKGWCKNRLLTHGDEFNVKFTAKAGPVLLK